MLALIVEAILDSEAAFRSMCSSIERAAAAEGSASAPVKAACHSAAHFWRDLAAVGRLLRPIKDGIEQIQGDAPMLSQVRSMWMGLIKHAEQWQVADDTPPRAKQQKMDEVSMLKEGWVRWLLVCRSDVHGFTCTGYPMHNYFLHIQGETFKFISLVFLMLFTLSWRAITALLYFFYPTRVW